VILENSCRAEARAGVSRTSAAIATIQILWLSGTDMSARNRSCSSVTMVEEEATVSERSPRKQQSENTEWVGEKALDHPCTLELFRIFFP